jgi:hypothetical protein
MDEGYSPPSRTRTRHLVNQAIPRCPARLDCRVQIGDTVADVMDAGAAFGQEFANRAVLITGSHQLHFGVPEGECNDGSSIDYFRWMRRYPEYISVKRERHFEVGHRNADMSYTGAVRHQSLRRKLMGLQARQANKITGE